MVSVSQYLDKNFKNIKKYDTARIVLVERGCVLLEGQDEEMLNNANHFAANGKKHYVELIKRRYAPNICNMCGSQLSLITKKCSWCKKYNLSS